MRSTHSLLPTLAALVVALVVKAPVFAQVEHHQDASVAVRAVEAAEVTLASSEPAEGAPISEDEALRQVEARFVCMINDALFDRPQIPVEVDGKTYYGCCPMCKERLAKDAEARQATDPVSGHEVDKATAVIGALPDGAVLYFENEANLAKHRAKLAGH